MKYELIDTKQEPEFRFFVQKQNNHNYYIFNNFTKALDKLMELCESDMFEPVLINNEWHMKRIFSVHNGEIEYLCDKSNIMSFVKFYCDTGECINYTMFMRGFK